MTPPDPDYRGRFAPSPTGPLHQGSLIAALASYLDARNRGGHWLLRMEDLDPPREQAGAAELILASLKSHALDWDGEVLWQSRRGPHYDTALQALQRLDLLFRCDCPRRLLGPGGACGSDCRERQGRIAEPAGIRLKVAPGTVIHFDDRLLGTQSTRLSDQCHDFIVRRRDGLYAYQLAVVVDDAWQGVNCVVRGSDLLDSTPRQIYLQRVLGLASPQYLHLPVITNNTGQKFSKQNHAPALEDSAAAQNLRKALLFLGQCAPPAEAGEAREIVAFAARNWNPQALPPVASVAATAETA